MVQSILSKQMSLVLYRRVRRCHEFASSHRTSNTLLSCVNSKVNHDDSQLQLQRLERRCSVRTFISPSSPLPSSYSRASGVARGGRGGGGGYQTGQRQNAESHAKELNRLSRELILIYKKGDNSARKAQHQNVDRLLHDWNRTLKQIQQTNLLEAVECVDCLVRTILSSKVASSQEVFATYVGLLAWARIAASRTKIDKDINKAAVRAEELFEALDFRLDYVAASRKIDIQSPLLRNRRNLYHALLLTWSRVAAPHNPEAARRALHWLERMKQEEESNNIFFRRLINVHCYNRVMAAFAACGHVEQVERLWSELEDRSIHANAVTYDCLVKAYQVQGGYPDRAYQVFHKQLANYQSLIRKTRRRDDHSLSSLKPLTLTLGRILYMYRSDPDRARDILDQVLAFEGENPECRGFVHVRSFEIVMHAFASLDRLEQAEDLLMRLFQLYEYGNDHLQPNRIVFGLVMDGYAQRKTVEAVARVEEILNSIEERVLKVDSAQAEGDCGAYNILMTSYLRTWPADALCKIERTISRMEKMAKRHENPNLRPDSISYTILMRALMRQGDPGFQYRVQDILYMMMQSISREGARPERHCFSVALDAWAKSDHPEAVNSAEKIMDLIERPDTTCYNIMANIYAKRGLVGEAFGVLNCMRSEYESGRNQECLPDNITYSTVIHALCNSRDSGGWEDALKCFDDMLARFEEGDDACKPSQETVASLLHLLKVSSETSDKLLAARSVLQRLARVDLVLGPTAAVAFIGALSETVGDQDHKREALAFVMEVLQRFGPEADATIYNAILEACDNIIDDEEYRNVVLADIFRRCADAGQVSRPLLQTLWRICPSDVYRRLTLQDPRKIPSLDGIPEDWKQCIVPHN